MLRQEQPTYDGFTQESLLTNAQKLEKAHIPYDEIPLEFIDFCFEFEIMDDPVKLDNQHIMDYNNLKKWWKQSGRNQVNPVTNLLLIKLELLPELKQTIEEFVVSRIDATLAFTKELEDKINKLRLQQEQQAKERKTKIEKYQMTRQELSSKIQQELGEVDEGTLKALLKNIDSLDKKIYKLTLGNAYYNDPHHIIKRIHVILINQEKNGLSEKEEMKLKKLLQKLEEISARQSKIISRFSRHTSFFYPSPFETILTLNPGPFSRRTPFE